jgi:hypothetical protein
MRLFQSSFANSLSNLFAQSGFAGRSSASDGMEAIRHKMLDLLGDRFDSVDTLALVRRIRLAMDVHELWFLRESLMSCMAQRSGEQVAREGLAALDRLFEGQLPRAMTRSRSGGASLRG